MFLKITKLYASNRETNEDFLTWVIVCDDNFLQLFTTVVLTFSFLIQKSFFVLGRHLWLREESLSTILSAEMIDLPLSENQAKMEEEFGHGECFSFFAKVAAKQLKHQSRHWTGKVSC